MKTWNRKTRRPGPALLCRMREHLDYDPETGHLTWKIALGSRKMGVPIGKYSNTPYIQLGFERKIYFAHQVAFALATGRWVREVDHENKNKRDNRWLNLREATRRENLINIGCRSNNTSGHPGVFFNRQANRWKAKVKLPDGREISRTGVSKEHAIQIRKELEIQHYGGFGA